MIGFMGHNPDIDRVITVGCGTGNWWYNAAPTKRFASRASRRFRSQYHSQLPFGPIIPPRVWASSIIGVG